MTSFIPLLLGGIAAPFALSVVALVGYLVGLKRRPARQSMQRETNVLRDKIHRADELLKQMDTVSRQLRHHLAAHHAALRHHRQQIADLSRQGSHVHKPDASLAINSLLAPADELAREIAVAYDQLRRDSRKLSQLRNW